METLNWTASTDHFSFCHRQHYCRKYLQIQTYQFWEWLGMSSSTTSTNLSNNTWKTLFMQSMNTTWTLTSTIRSLVLQTTIQEGSEKIGSYVHSRTTYNQLKLNLCVRWAFNMIHIIIGNTQMCGTIVNKTQIPSLWKLISWLHV